MVFTKKATIFTDACVLPFLLLHIRTNLATPGNADDSPMDDRKFTVYIYKPAHRKPFTHIHKRLL